MASKLKDATTIIAVNPARMEGPALLRSQRRRTSVFVNVLLDILGDTASLKDATAILVLEAARMEGAALLIQTQTGVFVNVLLDIMGDTARLMDATLA